MSKMNELSDDMEVADVAAFNTGVTLDKKRIGFMDLSAELRNTIYELALISTEKLHPVSTSHFDEDLRPLKTRWHVKLFTKHCWARPGASLSPNLLLTCKTVCAEATPILYGSNHFVLLFSYAGWTRSIGNSVKHLRTVTCTQEKCEWENLPHVLHSLKPATSLVRLVIYVDPPGVSCFYFSYIIKPAVDMLQDLALHSKIHKHSTNRSAIDVVEFKGDEFIPKDWDKFNVDVKKLLKKRVGS